LLVRVPGQDARIVADRRHVLEATGEAYWKPGREAIVTSRFCTV
jgi:hypothetical protein